MCGTNDNWADRQNTWNICRYRFMRSNCMAWFVRRGRRLIRVKDEIIGRWTGFRVPGCGWIPSVPFHRPAEPRSDLGRVSADFAPFVALWSVTDLPGTRPVAVFQLCLSSPHAEENNIDTGVPERLGRQRWRHHDRALPWLTFENKKNWSLALTKTGLTRRPLPSSHSTNKQVRNIT